MTIPPDPYALKAVETATKTVIELLHEDIKAGMAELLRIVKERGKDQAMRNVAMFNEALEKDITQRISIGVSSNGYERIEGNLNDPDFAYLVSQATIASARTMNPDKHKLLARAVIERLFAKPESLVALASSLACQIIPNLKPNHLTFLGLLVTVLNLEPVFGPNLEQQSPEERQGFYLAWLENELAIFMPYPKMLSIDYDHLQGMSCIDIERVGQRTWDQVFRRRTNPTISLPENYIENNEKIRELKKIDGLLRCTPTTVGAVIGTHVHDIKLNKNPTIFKWDDEE